MVINVHVLYTDMYIHCMYLRWHIFIFNGKRCTESLSLNWIILRAFYFLTFNDCRKQLKDSCTVKEQHRAVTKRLSAPAGSLSSSAATNNVKLSTSNSPQTVQYQTPSAVKAVSQQANIKSCSTSSPVLPQRSVLLSNTSTPATDRNFNSPSSGQSKAFSFKKTTPIGFQSPIPCGESFFEEDAKLTQTHHSFMSSFNKKSPSSSFKEPPVMNFNQSTNSLMYQSDTTCGNQSTSSSHFNQSAAVTHNSFSIVEAPSRTDFSFDYKLNNDSGVVQSQPVKDRFSSSVPDSEEEADVIDQFPDDLFSPDDFDSEFTEEVKTDSLPQLSSPRRQSTNQSFG